MQLYAQIHIKMVVIINEKKMYMDGYLKENADIIIEQINKADMDFLGIVDGFEGVGKSVIAMQLGYYIDPTLNNSRICFTADEFKEAVIKADKGQCVIFDEAITGAFSREAIKQMNVSIVKMMAQIRQKNLFILLVLPSFFDLDRNLAVWRSRFLIHCHFGKEKFQRGFFKFANLQKKKLIFFEGKKLYQYPRDLHKWNFWGRFSKFYPVNEEEYRLKKMKSLGEQDYESITMNKTRSQRDSLILFLYNSGLSQTDISEISYLLKDGITQKQVSNVITKYKENPEISIRNSNIQLLLNKLLEKGAKTNETNV